MNKSIAFSLAMFVSNEAYASCNPLTILDAARVATNIATVMDEWGNCVILVKTVEGKEFMAPVYVDNQKLDRIEKKLNDLEYLLEKRSK